jgi:hypothetical protein
MNIQSAESNLSNTSKRTHTLNAGQIITVSIIAIALWFIAATAVRMGSPLGMFGTTASALSFAVAIPVSWVSVKIIIKVCNLSPYQIVPGISLGLGIATLCDGLAITWASALYGSDPKQISLGAAWILWGVGAFTASAFFEAYRLGTK